MVVLTRSEFEKILSGIDTYPYYFPPLSLKEELYSRPEYYLSFAIWCIYGLPKPKNKFETESKKMLLDFISDTLEIVDDSMADKLKVKLC